MRGLIRQSVRRPVAVSMLYVGVALLAAAAWVNLPIEVDVSGDYPELHVTTSWGMAAPESVQALITSPIESLAVTLPDVRHVRSTSERGRSRVVIEFIEEVNLDLAVFELADRLALLRPDFPPGTLPSQVTQYIPRNFQAFQSGRFIEYMLQSPAPLNELRAWAQEELQVPLAAIDGVAQVEVFGGMDPHLRVTLDPELCELYGMAPQSVRNAINGLDESWPIGQVEMDGTAYTVRVDDAVSDLATLLALPLATVGGSIVRLSDVGTVAPAYEAVPDYTRVDGEQRVTLNITRRPGSDVLTVARAVRRRMAALQASFPKEISVEVLYDQAAELREELALLGRRLVIILILVGGLLVLLLRDLRTPLFLFATLAAALSLTIIALYHFGVPVNLLTLTGLALAFGMLVDNAVVVLENIVRYRESGLPRQLAAERGTAEVVVPVVAATLTTIGVFFPFALFQGRLRDYYLPLALAVTFALAASLLVALTLMPAAAGRGWVVRAPRLGRNPGRRYRTALGWGLRHPWLILSAVAIIGYLSYSLFRDNVPRGGFRGFGGGRDRLIVSLTLPPGSEPGLADSELKRFEDYVLGLPNIERVEVSVRGDNANLVVTFPPAIQRTAYPLLIKDELIGMATGYAGVRIGVYGFDPTGYSSGGFGYGPSYNSRIQLLGYNYEKLGEYGDKIARMALRNARVQEAVVTSGGRLYRSIGSELMLRVRRRQLALNGLTVDRVIAQLSSLLQGNTGLGRVRVGPREWDFQVKLKGVDRRTLRDILDSPALGATGNGIRLANVFEVLVRPIPGVITREDQRYDRWVQWEYRGSSRARANYQQAIFDAIELPPGYTAKIPEGFFLTGEEKTQIRDVAVAALIIIFMVLASLYESLVQPFIVLLSVPMSLIGVFLIFYFTGNSFGPSAAIGVVLLGGIVVNNAIILVDHVNLRRRQGQQLLDALVNGSAERVRPILVTSITTVGGLLPLVLVKSGEGISAGSQDIWSDLALATIGGLSAATLLTLTVIPVLYLLAERARAGSRQAFCHVRRIWRSLSEPHAGLEELEDR
ncbi:MAG: efflux RND transporter permease subunit [Acidobacteriota bacterium]